MLCMYCMDFCLLSIVMFVCWLFDQRSDVRSYVIMTEIQAVVNIKSAIKKM